MMPSALTVITFITVQPEAGQGVQMTSSTSNPSDYAAITAGALISGDSGSSSGITFIAPQYIGEPLETSPGGKDWLSGHHHDTSTTYAKHDWTMPPVPGSTASTSPAGTVFPGGDIATPHPGSTGLYQQG
jgi:hypothetical protein